MFSTRSFSARMFAATSTGKAIRIFDMFSERKGLSKRKQKSKKYLRIQIRIRLYAESLGVFACSNHDTDQMSGPSLHGAVVKTNCDAM